MEGVRRLEKAGGANTKFYSAGATSLADTRPSGPVSFLQGSMLLGVEAGGAISFYLADGLGSVRLITDGTGAAVATFSADEFGVPESATGPADLQAHSYTGALGVRNDTALSGLLYMRQRYYDPQLGRFLSQDPIGFAGGLNLFGYVNQNPINLVDPEGLEPKGTVIVNFGKVKRPVPTLPWKERRTQGLTSAAARPPLGLTPQRRSKRGGLGSCRAGLDAIWRHKLAVWARARLSSLVGREPNQGTTARRGGNTGLAFSPRPSGRAWDRLALDPSYGTEFRGRVGTPLSAGSQPLPVFDLSYCCFGSAHVVSQSVSAALSR